MLNLEGLTREMKGTFKAASTPTSNSWSGRAAPLEANLGEPGAVKAGPGGNWFIVSRAMADQLRASARFQGPIGRLMRQYLKGLPSRFTLGTNPSWLILQVISNGVLAALAGVGPTDFLPLRRAIDPLRETDPEAYELLASAPC